MKNFLDQFFLILMYGGIAQGIFVVLLLNNGRVRNSRANIFLSILLLSLTFSILHILYAGDVLQHFSITVHNVGDPTFFLIAPLLWFYTKELTGDKVRFRLKMLPHFIPFLTTIFVSLFYTNGIGKSTIIIIEDHTHKLTAILFWMIVVLQFSGYQFYIRRRWATYQRLMEQEVSFTENVNISWVKFFMAVFLLINFFFLLSLFAVIHLDKIFWSYKAIAVVFSLSVFALGYKGILQKEIFRGYETIESTQQTNPSSVTTVYNTPKAPVEDELINKLFLFMDEKRPYLDAELTLTELAKSLGISRSQLSHLINDGVGDNFYDFINKYRVEQVKIFFKDPAMKNYSLLGMAMEAGFKSKSTFNLIFKRFTGLTPTAYRKNILS